MIDCVQICAKSIRILMNKRDPNAFAICLRKVLQISSGESMLIWINEAGWLVALAQKLPVHEAHSCCQMLEWKDCVSSSNCKNATKPLMLPGKVHL